jgi:K+/H+ antiporter YhaU regulatory subunit KhtT
MVNWTYKDDYNLIEKHAELGDEWSLIAKDLTEKRKEELGEITANDAKNRMDTEIIKELSNIDKDIDYLEKYYKEKTEDPTITSLLSSDPNLQKTISDIRSKMSDLYQKTMAYNLREQKEINSKNASFADKKLDLDKKLGEYIINKDKSNSSSVYKLDIYDRNIEDNLFLIYYFLSYGILGLFIYKLLK